MASNYPRLNEGGGNPNYGTGNPQVEFARGSSTEFFQLCDRITTNLFSITKATSNLEKSSKMIGSSSDCQALRDRITQLNSDTGSYIQETTTFLRSLHPLTQGDKQRKVRERKLQSEFQAAATRFSETQKKTLKAVRTAPLPSDMVATELDSEASANQMVQDGEKLFAQKKELQSIEFEVAMQQEREHQIRALESDIVNIADIMKELSSMVVEQGTTIDSIENNVETAHSHVEEGRQELIKASSYQNKYRRRVCFLILVLIVVLIIIGVVLGIHFSSK